jgi:hypothetical protein
MNGEDGILPVCEDLYAIGNKDDRCDIATVVGTLGGQMASQKLTRWFDEAQSRELRVLIAVNLIYCGHFGRVPFLEDELSATRDLGTFEIMVAALAVAESPLGVAKATEIVDGGSRIQRILLRQAFSTLAIRAPVRDYWLHELNTALNSGGENVGQ